MHHHHVTVKAFEHHGGEPYMTPIDSKGYRAASKAVEKTFGKMPIPVRGGGSIPICSILEKELGIKIIFMGFGLDSDNLHSPNEKYGIENFYKGIETIPYFHKYFAEDSKLNNQFTEIIYFSTSSEIIFISYHRQFQYNIAGKFYFWDKDAYFYVIWRYKCFYIRNKDSFQL